MHLSLFCLAGFLGSFESTDGLIGSCVPGAMVGGEKGPLVEIDFKSSEDSHCISSWEHLSHGAQIGDCHSFNLRSWWFRVQCTKTTFSK